MRDRVEARALPIWAIALSLLAAGCASTGAKPRPFPTPSTRSAEPRNSPEPENAREPQRGAVGIVRTALDLRGIPYRNGGQTLDGFDCSGFTQFVFAAHGFFQPGKVVEQFKVGRSVTPDEIAPGDLIFFATAGRGPSHVAIAVNGGTFVHAPSSKGVVRVEQLGSSYWSQRLIGVRRLDATEQ